MEEEFGKKRRGDGKVYWKQTSFVTCRQKDKNEGRKEMVVERTRKRILTKKQKKEIN